MLKESFQREEARPPKPSLWPGEGLQMPKLPSWVLLGLILITQNLTYATMHGNSSNLIIPPSLEAIEAFLTFFLGVGPQTISQAKFLKLKESKGLKVNFLLTVHLNLTFVSSSILGDICQTCWLLFLYQNLTGESSERSHMKTSMALFKFHNKVLDLSS